MSGLPTTIAAILSTTAALFSRRGRTHSRVMLTDILLGSRPRADGRSGCDQTGHSIMRGPPDFRDLRCLLLRRHRIGAEEPAELGVEVAGVVEAQTGTVAKLPDEVLRRLRYIAAARPQLAPRRERLPTQHRTRLARGRLNAAQVGAVQVDGSVRRRANDPHARREHHPGIPRCARDSLLAPTRKSSAPAARG